MPLHPATWTVAGGISDQSVFLFWLAWVPHSLAHLSNPFVSHHLGAPDGVNAMWNTSMLLAGLVLAPVTAVFGPVASLTSIYLLAPVASAVTGTRLLQSFVTGPAAVVGGLLFAFSPFMTAHGLQHPNLVLTMLVPLMVRAAVDLLSTGGVRPGARLGLWAGLQILVTEETLVITAFGLVAVVACLAAGRLGRLRADVRRLVRGAGWAALVFGAIAGLPLAVQFAGPYQVRGALQPEGIYRSHAGDVFTAPSRLLLHSAGANALAAPPRNPYEVSGYVGWVVALVVLVGLIRLWRDPVVRCAAVALITAGVLSVGRRLHVGGHDVGPALPWAALERAPLLENLLPARLSLIVDLAAATIVAMSVDHLLRSRRRTTRATAWATAVACLLTWAPGPLEAYGSSFAAPVLVPDYFRSGAHGLRGRTVLALPLAPSYAAQSWQAISGLTFRILGGYSFRPPSRTPELLRLVEMPGLDPAHVPAPRWEEARRELARSGATRVTISPSPEAAALVVLVTRLVGRGPDNQAGDVLVWDLVTSSTPGSAPSPARR